MKLYGHVLQLIFIPTLFGHQILNGDEVRGVGAKKYTRLNSKMSSLAYDYHVLSASTEIAPWLVSLRHKINNQHFCSGSLISHYFIISVAQCVADRQLPENIMVIVETENLFIGGYKYDINDVFMQPEFRQENGRDNNLVLFQTRTPVMFSKNVYPIALESDCTSHYEELQMFGWSFVRSHNYFWKMGIQTTHMLTLDQELCALHQATTIREYLSLKQNSRQLCTYFTSIPLFCIESPGNAIVSTINVKNTPRLVAISSKTNSCYVRYPTANTRIASHIGWISKIMRINEPQIVNMMHS